MHFTSGVHNFFHQYNLHHVLVKELGPLETIFNFLAHTGLITMNFFVATKTFRGGEVYPCFSFFMCICNSIVKVFWRPFWYAHRFLINFFLIMNAFASLFPFFYFFTDTYGDLLAVDRCALVIRVIVT